MYLMYVDESGDCGLIKSPVRYFILTGLVLHENSWKQFIDDLISFRRILKASKGLKLREEIHSSEFVYGKKNNLKIKRNDRIDILKKCIAWCSTQTNCNIINVVVDKQGKSGDIFEISWNALIQRFENTIINKNFPNSSINDDKGVIIADNTDDKKLQQLIRKMRRYNPVPNVSQYYTSGYRNMVLSKVIEDPFFRESRNSYIHQLVDVISYFVRQLYEPNKYMKKKGTQNYFSKLNPVLCKVASTSNSYGIVNI